MGSSYVRSVTAVKNTTCIGGPTRPARGTANPRPTGSDPLPSACPEREGNSRGRPVVRIFPRATRRRVTAVVAACSMLLSVSAVPLAAADDLKDRKERVQGSIKRAERHLDQSSSRLLRTSEALNAAEDRLLVAEGELAEADAELAAAEVMDQRMQAA